MITDQIFDNTLLAQLDPGTLREPIIRQVRIEPSGSVRGVRELWIVASAVKAGVAFLAHKYLFFDKRRAAVEHPIVIHESLRCLPITRHNLKILVGQKFLVLVIHDEIAFASRLLEPGCIEYFHFAAAIPDNAVLLERIGDQADARPLHAEHMRQEFLGQDQVIIVRALAHYRKPAAQAGFDGVEMIANAGLPDLAHNDV